MSLFSKLVPERRPTQPPPVVGEHLDTCPWCDQPIPPEKLAEISGRMALREHQLVADASKQLKDQFALQQAHAEARAKGELEQARKEAAEAAERLRREAAQKEAAIREQAQKAAQEGVQLKLNDFQLKLAEAERNKQAALAGMQEKLQAKLNEAEAAKRAAEQQALALKAHHESEIIRRVHEAREALEKEKTHAVLAEQSKTFEERQKLQGKVQELQKQLLESKAALDAGEGVGINLYDALRSTFPGDRITRTNKGSMGADLIHEVMHNGKSCGKIIYDSRNRNLWRQDYVTRLKEDLIAAQADHAILSAAKFPAGSRQLHVEDGIVIACPARIGALAELFRAHLVQLHELRVSNESRGDKTAALYTFITSERCGQLFDMIDSMVEKVLEIDVAEHKAHQSVWEKRGRLLKSVLKAHGDLCFEIDRIIGTGRTAS